MSAARVVKLTDRRLGDGLPIVKGLPIPPVHAPNGDRARLRSTLKSLEIGDSFLWHEQRKIYTIARSLGVKVTMRRVESEPRRWRVWRIA